MQTSIICPLRRAQVRDAFSHPREPSSAAARGRFEVLSPLSRVRSLPGAQYCIQLHAFDAEANPTFTDSFLGEPALLVYNHGLVAVRWLSARIAAERVLPTKPSVDGSVPARSRCLEAPYSSRSWLCSRRRPNRPTCVRLTR